MHHARFVGIMVALLASCTVAPAATPTATPEPTFTLTPTPTPTLAPTPTPTVAPPSVVADYLNDVRVVKIHGFENLNGWRTWNSGTGHVAEGVFVLTGQKNWTSGLIYTQKLEEGSAALLKFKTTRNADWQSEVILASGEWDTDSWRTFGVYTGNTPKADLWQGKQGLGGGRLSGNFSPNADVWYELLLAVAEDGEFLAVVWNPEEPTKQISYHESIGEKWAGLKWELQAKANIGETAYLDDFVLLSFSSFK